MGNESQPDDHLNAGSHWHRWEPHIHAPGTGFNDRFKGPTAWTDYLTSLEQATPTIRAIAVTDYYCADTSRDVLREIWQEADAKTPVHKFGVELRPGDWWWYEKWLDHVRAKLAQA